MRTQDKSAGFELTIVLPAHVSIVKLFKKIQHTLPKGSAISMKPADLTLQEVKANFGESRIKVEGAISVNM